MHDLVDYEAEDLVGEGQVVRLALDLEDALEEVERRSANLDFAMAGGGEKRDPSGLRVRGWWRR